jgi:hypothetical protein
VDHEESNADGQQQQRRHRQQKHRQQQQQQQQPPSLSSPLPRQQQQHQHDDAEETADWATETGSSLSIAATPACAEVHVATRDAGEGSHAVGSMPLFSGFQVDYRNSMISEREDETTSVAVDDRNDSSASTALLPTELVATTSATERRARLKLRHEVSQEYLSERDQSFLARAASLELRRRASPSALNSSSSSSD